MSQEAVDKIKELEAEKNALIDDILKLKRRPRGAIAYLLLILGLVFLSLSLVHVHQVASFIGVGLIFWGALLLYVRPVKFMRKVILDSSLIDLYVGFLRVLGAQKLGGAAMHYSPGTFEGYRKVVLFIPKENVVLFPPDDKLGGDQLFFDDPPGICFSPPGLNLYSLFGRELATNLGSYTFDTLHNNLERVLVNDLEIVKSFEMELEANRVLVRVSETIYEEILKIIVNDQGNTIIGDPLFSGISCALAIYSRKPVKITYIGYNAENGCWEARFELLELDV
jgi:hypothetical protein